MYIARLTTPSGFFFVLRQSVKTPDGFASRDIFPLGTTPGLWLRREDRTIHLDPVLEEAVRESLGSKAPKDIQDQLEELLLPWFPPGIRREWERFAQRGAPRPPALTPTEKKFIEERIPDFDKRRVHFLRFDNMDQGAVKAMPPVLFRHLLYKSRDEIEQGFMADEAVLKAKDLKSYVYTALNLSRHFKGFLAPKMPHVLDPARVGALCEEELCRINKALFPGETFLHPYLVRYLIMFFDYDYAPTKLLDEMSQDFIFRHRHHRTGKVPPSISPDKALEFFGLTPEEFKGMDRRSLTKKYRKLAGKHHPDRGGKHKDFVQLNESYQALLEKLPGHPEQKK